MKGHITQRGENSFEISIHLGYLPNDKRKRYRETFRGKARLKTAAPHLSPATMQGSLAKASKSLLPNILSSGSANASGIPYSRAPIQIIAMLLKVALFQV
jgi:hypothetical protein